NMSEQYGTIHTPSSDVESDTGNSLAENDSVPNLPSSITNDIVSDDVDDYQLRRIASVPHIAQLLNEQHAKMRIFWILFGLAIFSPPLCIYYARGNKCSFELIISVLLTILCWFPGVIFALFILVNEEKIDDEKKNKW
ncbi:unnamed protein product, partial [Didymodactylos carnosus]